MEEPHDQARVPATAPAPEQRALGAALERMRWCVAPGRFALVGFPEPPVSKDLGPLVGDGPAQAVREGGETTLLVPLEAVAELRVRHPGMRVEAPLAWIRFELALDWELVGFLATVTGRLAERGVPLGCVCGMSRDHLFVAEPYLDRALEALAELLGPASR